MLRTYRVFVSIVVMMTVVASAVENNHYNINVINDTNQDFAITHPIPAYMSAAICVELTNIECEQTKHNIIDKSVYTTANAICQTNSQVLKIQLSNYSKTTMGAFLTVSHSGDFLMPVIVLPCEELEGWESPKNKRTFITTAAGTFLFGPDNQQHPSKYLLRQYVKGGHQNSRIVQQLPYDITNDIIIVVNCDGTVAIIVRG